MMKYQGIVEELKGFVEVLVRMFVEELVRVFVEELVRMFVEVFVRVFVGKVLLRVMVMEMCEVLLWVFGELKVGWWRCVYLVQLLLYYKGF